MTFRASHRFRATLAAMTAATALLGVTLTVSTSPAVAAALSPTWVANVPSPFVSGHAGAYPWGMGTLSDGNIAVGDYWNQKVQLYSPSGTLLNANLINNVGFGPGQTQSPYGLATDPVNGDFYIADTDRYLVHRYAYNAGTMTMTQVAYWGAQGNGLAKFLYPSRIAVDSNERVYVADTWANNIEIDTNTGTGLKEFGSFGTGQGQFKQPHGMAFRYNGPGVQDDQLYVVNTNNKRIDVFRYNAADGYVDLFDHSFGCAKSTGNANCHFTGDLRGLAIDESRGNAYVVDAAGNNVDVYTLAGTWVRELGRTAKDVINVLPGEFTDGGREVTVDPATGYVWVGDMPDFRVQVFDPQATTFATQIVMVRPDPAQPPPDGGFNGPRGVALDQNGNIFVTDTYNQRIEKFDPNGTFVTKWGSRGRSAFAFNYPRMLAVDRNDGTVVVADTDNHQIKKYSNDGSTLVWAVGGLGTTLGKFKNPHGVDVGPDGTIYVADSRNSRVVVLNSSGTAVRAFGTNGTGNGQFKFPRGIVLDDNGTSTTSDDTLWVVDSTRDVVQHFTVGGAYLGQFGAKCSTPCAANQFGGPFDIAATGGYLFVADAAQHFVRVWTDPCYGTSAQTSCGVAAQYVTSFGGRGTQNGKMVQPQGLDVSPDGQYLFVAEQDNDRISMWKLYA
jgi:tripartite motif-containing protein 71